MSSCLGLLLVSTTPWFGVSVAFSLVLLVCCWFHCFAALLSGLLWFYCWFLVLCLSIFGYVGICCWFFPWVLLPMDSKLLASWPSGEEAINVDLEDDLGDSEEI